MKLKVNQVLRVSIHDTMPRPDINLLCPIKSEKNLVRMLRDSVMLRVTDAASSLKKALTKCDEQNAQSKLFYHDTEKN